MNNCLIPDKHLGMDQSVRRSKTIDVSIFQFIFTIYMYSIKTDWWYTYPSEKYEFVSWGYYSQYMEK